MNGWSRGFQPRTHLLLALAVSVSGGLGLDRPALAQTSGDACFPSCRAGFVCFKAQCVSACNPACAANETCTPSGECVPLHASAPVSAPPASILAPTAVPPPVSNSAPVYSPAAPVVTAPAQPVQVPVAPAPWAADSAARPVSPAKSSSGVHLHNGFYMRMALGLGAASSAASDITSSSRMYSGAGVDTQSLAIPIEFAMGGTPAPGLVIGAGNYSSVWPTPRGTLKNYGQQYDSQAGPMVVTAFGPFLDYYFNPERGVHWQLGAALANATLVKSTDQSAPLRIPSDTYTGAGWALMTGLGTETWIGDQWSFGILGRVQYGQVTLKDSGGNSQMDTAFLIVGALATFTYH